MICFCHHFPSLGWKIYCSELFQTLCHTCGTVVGFHRTFPRKDVMHNVTVKMLEDIAKNCEKHIFEWMIGKRNVNQLALSFEETLVKARRPKDSSFILVFLPCQLMYKINAAFGK